VSSQTAVVSSRSQESRRSSVSDSTPLKPLLTNLPSRLCQAPEVNPGISWPLNLSPRPVGRGLSLYLLQPHYHFFDRRIRFFKANRNPEATRFNHIDSSKPCFGVTIVPRPSGRGKGEGGDNGPLSADTSPALLRVSVLPLQFLPRRDCTMGH